VNDSLGEEGIVVLNSVRRRKHAMQSADGKISKIGTKGRLHLSYHLDRDTGVQCRCRGIEGLSNWRFIVKRIWHR
jgi:hypothetical protein